MSKPAQTYTNTLSPIAKIRVLSDRNLVKQDAKGYGESDIHFLFNDNTLDNEFKILTIGSREIENPYFGGFFMFFGKFPDQYPFMSPHILAKTQGLNTRFHPNYYVNGKCCLSILGTWSGPPWTSCQNLGTVSQQLKSLFIDNPITQEPGWEKTPQEKSNLYNLVVGYRTLEIAVLEMLENPPIGFDNFMEIMERTFIELYKTYILKLDNFKIYQGKTIKSPIYDIKIVVDVDTLKSKFIAKYKTLIKKYTIPPVLKAIGGEGSGNSEGSAEAISADNKATSGGGEVSSDNKIKIIKEKKSPNEKASQFEIGYKLQSTNSDKKWWVVNETKTGLKRWKQV